MWNCPNCGPVGSAVLHGEDEQHHCIECDAVCFLLTPEERRVTNSAWGSTKKKRGRLKKLPPDEEDEDG